MKNTMLLATALVGAALTSATFSAPSFAGQQSDQMTRMDSQIEQQLLAQGVQQPTVTVGGNPYYNGWQPTAGGCGTPAQTVPPAGESWYTHGGGGWQPTLGGNGVPAQTVPPGQTRESRYTHGDGEGRKQARNNWQPTVGGNGVPAQTVPPRGSGHGKHSHHDHK